MSHVVIATAFLLLSAFFRIVSIPVQWYVQRISQ